MPTYEYRCRRCGHDVEVVQSFGDDPLTTCDVCAGEMRKVFSPVGISFKGSGFYKTDSRSSSASGRPAKSDGGSSESKESTKAGSAVKGDSSSGSSGSSGKSEGSTSKPAAASSA